MDKKTIQEEIQEAAAVLFLQEGYDRTGMDQIARASSYTKRTVYRHFVCKEDLYFAVLTAGQKRMIETVKGRMAAGTGALEQLRLAVTASKDFFLENEALFELMSQVKAIRNQRQDIESLPHYRSYVQYVKDGVFGAFANVFCRIREESAGPDDKESERLMYAAMFQIMAFFQMYAIAGDTYVEAFGLDKPEFIDYSLQLLQKTLEHQEEKT